MEATVSEVDREFCLDLCGIELKDRNVLKRILSITHGRTRSYSLFNPDVNEQADIIIVNADDSAAVEEWTRKYVGTNGISMVATVFASRHNVSNELYSNTALPFFPTRILNCLDEVTVKDLKYTPELRIEEPSEDSETVNQDLNNYSYKTELSKQEIETFIGSRSQIQNQNKKNVLIVDDSLPVRKALDMKLRLMNYDVQHASSGREALHSLQNGRFDFIFLDVVMPGIDGYEVCKLIKRNKLTKNIPVVMLTSRTSPFDKVKGRLAGCDSYLTKPVENEKFEKVVAGMLI